MVHPVRYVIIISYVGFQMTSHLVKVFQEGYGVEWLFG